ncbi:branched-chain amino acid ABC transporter permease [Natronorubrum thiooxidans]|uniref:Amino acid/amide ABC transporter membrane protein 2, HAAT family n=1 Tax=Natronorubrum thiooxidans TaxID=308853 RepID=A0A1N7GYC8_9EURY|nr:branched-chain amino acid ABC transporter permease [Natronorubrum thiooxidans]SIS17594.1 amino acid/amide ABC transporter membrane protein 2, HAAT family [Natronorubrum thiooxidans]
MSEISTQNDSARLNRARLRYRQFRGQWYSTPLLLTAIFGTLLVLPLTLNLYAFGFSLGTWVSVHMLIITLVWATTGQAWNMMSGYTGQFSFGHAAFFGLGAYGTILLLSTSGVNPWLGMFIGATIAGLYGLVIGVLCFRYDLRGHYFALATLAFAELLRYTFNTFPQLGGASGFFKPLPRQYADEFGLAAFQFDSVLPYYYVILVFLIIVTGVSLVIKQSRLGLYMFAIRENEDAASAVGIPTYRYKLVGITVSAFFTAWAGAFWAMYFDTIRPETVYDILINVEILLPAIVGGIGTVIGPIVGAFIVIPLSEIVRQFINLPGLDRIVYGLLLIGIVLYSPQGIVSWPGRFFEILEQRGLYENTIDNDDSRPDE